MVLSFCSFSTTFVGTSFYYGHILSLIIYCFDIPCSYPIGPCFVSIFELYSNVINPFASLLIPQPFSHCHRCFSFSGTPSIWATQTKPQKTDFDGGKIYFWGESVSPIWPALLLLFPPLICSNPGALFGMGIVGNLRQSFPLAHGPPKC